MKNLTIIVLAGALLPACIITTDGTSVTDTFETSNATTGEATNGTTGGTTGGTDSGTTAGASDSATESGTTETPPTTGEPTTGGTTGGTTGEGTTGTTGPTSPFGMCGWVADMNYYGCADEGADPGVSDPSAMDPIECSPKVVEGGDCSDVDGPVGNIGCCAPNGDLFLCNSQGPDATNKIERFECGA